MQHGFASCFRPSLRDGRGGFVFAWYPEQVFLISLEIAELLCNRTTPSEASAAILPPLLTPTVGVCACTTQH